MPGTFVISLDFELLWGMRDVATRDSYGRNVLGVRSAIPAMLDLFHRRSIHATWAAVGLALCGSKEELWRRLPARPPSYSNAALSAYSYLDEVGSDERTDPYYFGASLGRMIVACPGQELGTHTFSHYYCLEDGQTLEQFKADLRCAVDQLADWGVACRSIVFPRNQFSQDHLRACRDAGLTHFRGSARGWFNTPAPRAAETWTRRLARLLDAYVELAEPQAPQAASTSAPLINVAASRFLRPYRRHLAAFDAPRLRRIAAAMEAAAVTGGTFHLWWHPHNFGVDLDANMNVLSKIIACYERLAGELGMQSRTMSELRA